MGAPGLYLLFLDEVRVVQFQDMGVTLHLAPQEILTRHLRLYQANPAVEGRLTVTVPPGVLLSWLQEH